MRDTLISPLKCLEIVFTWTNICLCLYCTSAASIFDIDLGTYVAVYTIELWYWNDNNWSVSLSKAPWTLTTFQNFPATSWMSLIGYSLPWYVVKLLLQGSISSALMGFFPVSSQWLYLNVVCIFQGLVVKSWERGTERYWMFMLKLEFPTPVSFLIRFVNVGNVGNVSC